MDGLSFKKGDKLVIIGGGFAGLQLAKSLHNKDLKILLIDKQNHHQFQPLLYQIASARLEPASISFPFRKVFQKYNNIDFAKNKEIKNLHINKRCFIIGLGTSINKQDLKLLKDEIVIGISSLFNHKDLEYIQPNYYVLSPVIDNHSKYVNKDNLIKWLQAMDEKLDNSVVMFIYIGDKKYIDGNKRFKN